VGQFDRPLTSLAKSSKARLGEIIIAPPTGPRRVLEPKKKSTSGSQQIIGLQYSPKPSRKVVMGGFYGLTRNVIITVDNT